MAINLLGNLFNNPNSVSRAGGGSYVPSNMGVGGMSIAPKMSTMGSTATTPYSSVSAPSKTLPTAQTAPVSNYSSYSAPSQPVTYDYNTGKPLGAGQQQSQFNTTTGQRIGGGAQPSSTPQVTQPQETQTQSQDKPYSDTNLPTYGGLLGHAANQAGYLNTQAGSINDTAKQIGQYGQVTPQEQAAKDRLAGIPGLLGSTDAAIESNPGQYAFQMGREAVAGRNIEAMRQSLAAQAQAYATSREANTQAYTGQANAQNQAGGLLGNAMTGYQNAANGAKSETSAYGQTSFNPITQQFGNGSAGVSPSDPLYPALQSYATMAANGQYSAIPTSITGNPALSAQLNSMAQKLNPQYNPITSAAQGAGQASVAQAPYTANASNIGTSGTAAANSYNSIYSAANTQAATTATQQAQIRSVGQQALGLMQSDPNINKFVTQYGNKAINTLATQLSDPQYAAFNTAIQSLKARIGAALQAGEIPTAATGNAASIANGDISLNALGATLSQVDTELSSFVQTQNALANYAKGQMGSGGSSGSQSDPLNLGI